MFLTLLSCAIVTPHTKDLAMVVLVPKLLRNLPTINLDSGENLGQQNKKKRSDKTWSRLPRKATDSFRTTS